jgi:CheY-like chemotaxis protein
VLVVDDNPINRDMAVELLESFGLAVSAADGGPAAIELFGAGGIQLVLLDKEMPGMDGPATARALRALPGGQVPILAWTANTFEFDRRQCLAAGMDDFIPKPIEPRLLHAILAKWIPAPLEEAPAPWALPATSAADITCTGGWTPSVLALDTAIAVLGGSRERAVHYLGRFPHDHRGDLADIGRLAAEGDLPAAARAAQELGGVAVGLGLEALARASGRLAAALQQPAVEAALVALTAAAEQAMNDALTAIHDVLTASGQGAPLHSSVEAALELLDALLEADDAQAVEVWTQVRAPLTAWVGAAPVEPIASAIDRFDLAGARVQLAGLRRR